MKFFLVFMLSLSFVWATPSQAGRRSNKRIKVQGVLKKELNAVLGSTNDLHTACIERDESKLDASFKALLKSIDRAEQRSVLAGAEQTHVVRVLEAAKGQLEMSRMQRGKDRQKSLKGAFEQLVLLAQVYDLDRYRIFFCPKDRTVWLQKGLKPKNPIHPKLYSNCGKLVR